MKALIGFTCLAILIVIGQNVWSRDQDDKFEEALAEIEAREALEFSPPAKTVQARQITSTPDLAQSFGTPF